MRGGSALHLWGALPPERAPASMSQGLFPPAGSCIMTNLDVSRAPDIVCRR